MSEERAGRAARHDDRRAAQRHPRSAGQRTHPAIRRPVLGRGVRGGQAGGRRPGQPDDAALGRAAFRVGGPRRADPAAVWGRSDLPAAGGRRVAGDHDPRHQAPEARREMGPGGRDRAPRQGPRGQRQGPRIRQARAVDGQPARQGPAQRGARRPRLPDRRARGLRRQRQLLLDLDSTEHSSRSTTWLARASVSRGRRSSRSTT